MAGCAGRRGRVGGAECRVRASWWFLGLPPGKEVAQRWDVLAALGAVPLLVLLVGAGFAGAGERRVREKGRGGGFSRAR